MAVKVFIKRIVAQDKGKQMIPLFREMRSLAMNQPGYISGETLRNLEKPTEFLVISTWQSSKAWEDWLNSKGRQELQGRIDELLGGNTEYTIYHYGFTE